MDTKKQVERIDLANLSENESIILESDKDIFFFSENSLKSESDAMLYRTINLEFMKNDITSDIYIRMIVDQPIKLELKVILHANAGIKGVASKLDMRALLLNDNAQITFVPVLEIDELDVAVDHKSTIGSPPISWIRYMKSRGLDDISITGLIRNSFLNL